MRFLNLLLAAASVALLAPTVSQAATCKSIFDTGGTSYAAFTSCSVTRGDSFGGVSFSHQDSFSDKTNGNGNGNGNGSYAGVATLVELLFKDVDLVGTGTYSPGDGVSGGAFDVDSLSDDFDISDDEKSVTLSALPTNTIFVSLKSAQGFELFGLAGLGSPMTFTTAGKHAISHISTFAGTVAPVPVPAAGLLLLGGLGGLGGLSALRRRKARTA